MIDYKTITFGSKIAFSTYGTIGNVSAFSGIFVGAIHGSVVPSSAQAFVNHSNIYPQLPAIVKAATEDNYQHYTYLQVLTVEGNTIYIGIPWIVDTTLVITVNRTVTVTINNFTDETSAGLRAWIAKGGWEPGTITISDAT